MGYENVAVCRSAAPVGFVVMKPLSNLDVAEVVMTKHQNQNVTTGVRGRVVGKTIENLKARQPKLSIEFLEELRELLTAEVVPKADGYLQLFDKQIGGDS